MKELTIEMLCAMIPHGVKVRFKDPQRNMRFKRDGVFEDLRLIGINEDYAIGSWPDFTTHGDARWEVKPLLRPLSQFGDSDDLRKVHEFIGIGKWCDAYDNYFHAWFDDLSNIDKLVLQAPYEIFRYFLANHYDVFGLIKAGLAEPIPSIPQ